MPEATLSLTHSRGKQYDARTPGRPSPQLESERFQLADGSKTGGQTKMKTYHEVLPRQADRLDGALDVDGGLLLRAVGVGEVDLGSRPLGDVLDVAAVAALHEEVVLGSDVQVGGDGDGAGQAAGQVLQQQGGAPLGRRGHGTGQRNGIGSSLPVLMCSDASL